MTYKELIKGIKAEPYTATIVNEGPVTAREMLDCKEWVSQPIGKN